MKSYKVYINGKFVPEKQAQIPIYDSAYLYGEGVFETLIAVNGHIPFLKDHLQRLRQGARSLGITLPFDQGRLEKEILRTLKANGLQDAYVRVNVSGKEAFGQKRPKASPTHLVIIVKALEPYPKRLYREGARLILLKNLINDPACVAAMKTTNYLVKVMGRRQVIARGADEGIFLNAKGRVTECTSSNIFIVKKNRIKTPNLSEGLMPGVTRKRVIQLAKQQGLAVRECVIGKQELQAADEIFITSTLKGIMPVARVDQKNVGPPIPGPVTQKLMAAYERRLGIKSSRKDLANVTAS